jgi:hypothetical protein
MFDFNEALLQFGKLIIAALLGGAIGFERETHGQAAGIRTNILVGVGACLMMMLSLHIEEIFRHLNIDSVVRLDPGRIASYAIASMGFLGAGAIIKGKGSVRGLTTYCSGPLAGNRHRAGSRCRLSLTGYRKHIIKPLDPLRTTPSKTFLSQRYTHHTMFKI